MNSELPHWLFLLPVHSSLPSGLGRPLPPAGPQSNHHFRPEAFLHHFYLDWALNTYPISKQLLDL